MSKNPHADKRPNILFIFPDQWRYDGFGFMENPLAETPFLDNVFNTGTSFSCAYTNCPTCIAARASLMTGKLPMNTGRHGYQDRNPWPYENMYPELLRNSGYQTLLSGKTHFYPPRVALGYEKLALYDNQRFEENFRSDYDLWLEDKTAGQLNDTAQELDSNSMVVHPWTHDESLHANSWVVTEGIEFIKRRDTTRPFMLQLNFHRPHPPIDPPVEYMHRFENKPLSPLPEGDWSKKFGYDNWCYNASTGTPPQDILDRCRRAYYAQLAHLDFQIGRMLRYLQLNHMIDNTMVIFSSDHGEMLGDHHIFRKSCPFEGSARIPLAVRMAATSGIKQTGETCDNPVGLHDIMPTILEAAEVDIPQDIDASSLLPLARGEKPHWRDCIPFEHLGSPIGSYQALCNGQQKYVWQTVSGEEFLFDLETDPQETMNLANDAAYQPDVQSWREKLVQQISYYERFGLIKDRKLTPGNSLPVCEDWVKNYKTKPYL